MTNSFIVSLKHKRYCFVRTCTGRWFNIEGCHTLTDGDNLHDRNGLIPGLIPNAVKVAKEEIAELVAQVEEYNERLARTEALLKEWIAYRQAWSRKGKQKQRIALKKKELVK